MQTRAGTRTDLQLMCKRQKCAQTCRNVQKRGLLTGGAVIELSQFHLANEGEGSSLPFRMLQANNHIETRGDVAGAGWGHIM